MTKRLKIDMTRAGTIVITFVIVVVFTGVGLYTNTIKLPIKKELRAQYIVDFSNDRMLMGASHNVFVGKIIEKVGTKPIVNSVPATQYLVEVIYPIKGVMSGNVIVNQEGGYKNGILYVMHEGDQVLPGEDVNYLLQKGSTYLLATRGNNPMEGVVLISHPNARKLISSESGVSNEELRASAASDTRVEQLKMAYPEEILLEWDVSSGNTWNSYDSVRPIQL